MKYLFVLLLLATPVFAEQSAEEGCQQILGAYSQLEIKAVQAKLTASIQDGIVQICRKLIEAEKAAKAVKEEPIAKTEEKK